jgi:Ion channel
MTILIATAAALLLILILVDVFEVMLLPRRVRRRLQFMHLFFRGTWAIWSRLALHIPSASARERVLSVYGPLSMVLLFAVWSVGLIIGFALLQLALHKAAGTEPPLTLTGQLYLSGTTFFTLGYGDITPQTATTRMIAVVEAGTGLGFIAVVIGYLPVLYQLFFRREAHVIQLDGRAGSPPTAGTLLQRHAESGGLDKLDDLLLEWEHWCSEMLESHLSYPILVYYRSQHDNQSWLSALAAVMDCCALILVGLEDMCPLQARMTFTMARMVIVEMDRSFHTHSSRLPVGDRLPHEIYLRMETGFTKAGLNWNGSPETEATLTALRATYEPLLVHLSRYLLAPLPGWIAAGDVADNWERGQRGITARRLINELTDRVTPPTTPDSGTVREKRWRRLRKRLRS